jgi:hypothetical protein
MRFQIPFRILGVFFWVVDVVADCGLPSADGGHSTAAQEDLEREARVGKEPDTGIARFRTY